VLKSWVMALPAPNGLGKTLRTYSGPCNVVLRPFRMVSLGHRAQPATMIGFKQIEFFDHSASSERLACSVGDSPTGERVRDPVAWVAFVEETKRMKPTDKAILGMVSESPGRNVSEPRSGLDKK
jgi:hypothetical protein